MKIIRNIGHSCLKVGKFTDAIQSYEEVMENYPDHSVCFNLMLGYYAIGDVNRMKTAFNTLCAIEFQLDNEETDIDDENRDVSGSDDPLAQYMKDKSDKAINTIVTAGRLLAPLINPDNVY